MEIYFRMLSVYYRAKGLQGNYGIKIVLKTDKNGLYYDY